jgi:hypothetical protein
MIVKQSTHVRLPERSDAVAGPEQVPGQPSKTAPIADPRTTSQEPATNRKGLTP